MNAPGSSHKWLGLAVAFCIVLIGAGCSSGYVLQGRVIRGDFSSMAFVSPDDERLMSPGGLDGVELMVFRDPNSLGRSLVTRGFSGSGGRFSVPIDAFGAGWLAERWELWSRRGGYENANFFGALPGAGKNRRLLIIMAPGDTQPVPTGREMLDDYERFR